MLKKTPWIKHYRKFDAMPSSIQNDRITLKCGSAVKIFNLSGKIQEIKMSAKKLYGKQLYRQGVRG